MLAFRCLRNKEESMPRMSVSQHFAMVAVEIGDLEETIRILNNIFTDETAAHPRFANQVPKFTIEVRGVEYLLTWENSYPPVDLENVKKTFDAVIGNNICTT